MKIISNKAKLIKLLKKETNIGFIPTLGALHQGHDSLIKRSLNECSKTVVSIFINKPQFNAKSDFMKYPRILSKDISRLKKLKISFLYLPTFKQIYPNGIDRNIKINSLENKLCGKFRPGHFKSVVDVVNRLIKIIKPKKIFFGEKDMQQFLIIKNFVIKNYQNIRVIPCKTIREKNGIACSSRNYLLDKNGINIASKVYKLLSNKKKDLVRKKVSVNNIKAKIIKLGVKKIEYIKILDINKLIRPHNRFIKLRIFISYYLKNTRLIDNI
jgi:pantoate--beta-alanine ligase